MFHWHVNTPYLIIPVEIRVREFDAKLLLSCVAAEAGFSVVLGWSEQIKRYTSCLPKGIVVERSAGIWKLQDFRRYKRRRQRIVTWCEEGLETLGGDFYVKDRISPEVLDLSEHFFAWGANQVDMIATRLPQSAHKIVPSGNVRFDLLQRPYRELFSSKVHDIQQRYGPFILVNTNFAHYNNVLGREVAFKRLERLNVIQNQDDKDFYWQWSEYAREKYQHFVAMVAQLSETFPHHTIVVRPHPSENFDAWRQETESLANVHVVHDGNVVPWLMAAEVLIHNSCTTGVEAYLLDTPVVAYRPVTSETFESNLGNNLSTQVTSLAELCATLQDILAQPHAFAPSQHPDPSTREMLQHHIANLDSGLAADRIVSTLQEQVQHNLLASNDRVNALRNRMRWHAVQFIQTVIVDTFRPLIIGKTYGEHKFRGVSLQEVEQLIADLQDVSGRFKQVEVRPGGLDNLFHIQQKLGD